MRRNGFLIVAVMSAMVCFSGCATNTEWPEFSGFLKDYSGMYRSSDMEGIFIVNPSQSKVSDYSKFIVDPVTVQLTPNAIAYNMSANELAKIAESFRKSIIAELNDQYTVVESPAQDVMRVRVAITDILANKRSSASVGIVEAEFSDARTRERIAAILTSADGMVLSEWAALLKNRLEFMDKKTKIYTFE